MTKTKIIKIVSIVMFISSIVFFFLPYRADNMGIRHNGLSMIQYGFEHMSNDWGMEMIMRFAVPVVVCVIAGIVMLVRTNTITSIIATVLSVIAFYMYHYYIGDYMGDSYGIEIGLIINYIISIVGIILPIVVLVLSKLEKKNK